MRKQRENTKPRIRPLGNQSKPNSTFVADQINKAMESNLLSPKPPIR